MKLRKAIGGIVLFATTIMSAEASAATACTTNADCALTALTSCDTASGFCRVACAGDYSVGLISIDECDDAARPACQREGALVGQCTECSATNLTVCATLADRPACVVDRGVCGCNGDADCKTGVCDATTARCVESGTTTTPDAGSHEETGTSSESPSHPSEVDTSSTGNDDDSTIAFTDPTTTNASSPTDDGVVEGGGCACTTSNGSPTSFAGTFFLVAIVIASLRTRRLGRLSSANR